MAGNLVLWVGLKYSKKDVEKLSFLLRDAAKVSNTMPIVAMANGLDALLRTIEVEESKKGKK